MAAEPEPLGLSQPKAPRADKVVPFTGKTDKKRAEAMRKGAANGRKDAARARADQSREVTWPKAGSATLTLPPTGTASAAPGALPVSLTRPAAVKGAAAPKASSTLMVDVLDQKRVSELGVKGVVLTATAPAAGGSAQLGINYKSFASAYGGDWAGRLQLVRLPDCALTDPAAAKCRARTPLEFTNQRQAERMDARLEFKPTVSSRTASSSGAGATAAVQTMVLALAAGDQSASGDYKATPLSSSSSWEAGGSSGSFTWSYPLRVPPSAAGPRPDLGISYDSGTVDGRTASTNNQGSLIGEGFDITSSYIERKYGTCDDDGQADKFDLCWKYDNASLVLNGKSTELVKDDTSGKWRLKNDDASTVERSTGADNGDDDGEHWTVTTGNGTQYVFGLNKLDGAGADDRTKSVWTVPVFGDDSGEPGYADGTTFSGRAKEQAWRWNLDYVVDTHGNAMSYWYEAETNNYDQLGDDTTGTPYTRGGYLKEIRYGQRAGALFSGAPAASNKVVFSYAERCIATGTGCDELIEDSRDNWPDVPFDAVCKDGDKCTGNAGPTFFTRKRMTAVTTYAWDALAATPAFVAVDAWALSQTYLDPGDTGDSTDQSLWLDSIRHTGKRGTAITLDPVTFDHVFLANRVDNSTDGILPLYKPRLYTVTSETGAQTIVNYLPADCTAGETMPKVDENTRRCYPVHWNPNGSTEAVLDWFHKYPVHTVDTTDPKGGSEAVQHIYSYSGGGAWHYNEDPFVKEKERTWSTWRGFQQVSHLTGAPGKTQSKTVTVYLRGMNGDRVLGTDGKTPHPTNRKSVTVTGIKAPAVTDADYYAGFTRESVTYNGATGPEIGGAVNDPWAKRTATQHKSYADIEAHFVRTNGTHARTSITTSLPARDRIRSTVTTFDDYGMAATVEDRGDDGITGDEKCTRTWYARNDALGINSLVSRTRTVTKPCATADSTLDLPSDAGRAGDVISDTATAYDTTTTTWSASQVPTKGEARWAGRVKAYGTDDQPQWQKAATTTYDDLGRVLTVKDTNDSTTATTTYLPADAGPLTSTTVANAKGHTSTTLVDFATGAARKATDPNGEITESEYDALGRVTKVWLPGQSTSINEPPNYVYAYSVTASDLPWVSTGTLRGSGAGYNTTYQIYDSQLRPRQTQSPSPMGGSVISQTLYDGRGLAVSAQADIWAESTEPSGSIVETASGQAPVQTDSIHDGAARAVQATTKHYNVVRWTTETSYTGDTVTSTAPAGGQATAVVTNALGQTTERREYGGPQPIGTDYTTTAYTYTPAGQQATVTGPDNAKWTYGYDLFGRTTTTADPDKGSSTTEYNELDQAVAATDARGKKLVSEYDVLGRKTGLWDGTKTDATKLAAWTFDTLEKGQQDTAVRYDGGVAGKAYTSKVTKYDNQYRVTAGSLTLPDSEPLVTAGVPKTLAFTTAYNPDGTVKQTGSPAAAGLPSEIVSNTYGTLGQQQTAKGTTGYLQSAVYSPLGDLRQITLGTDSTSTANKAQVNYDYEAGTRRLTRSYVTDTVHSYMLQELKFTQDDAGNVTSIFDATTQGGASKPDYQCFTYDGHRRVTEAWTPKTADCAASGRTVTNLDGAAPYWTSYTYTASGQRKTETQHTGSGSQATTYNYGTPDNQPHPLASTTGAKAATYTYDKTGNTTSRPGTQAQQTLTWNSEGKLVGTSEPAAGGKPATGTSYLYGADGELLIRRNTTADGDTVLYLGGTEVRLTTKGTAKTLSGTRYYTAAGQTIAVRTATVGVTGTKLNFLAGDHHGTSSLAIDATTLAPTKRYTAPFGAPRGTAAAWPDDKAFLGKPADTTTGLTHIGAREYDPSIGQFISVDPLLSLDQHQSLNGYSYANQHPATAADPTGLKEDDGSGGRGPTFYEDAQWGTCPPGSSCGTGVSSDPGGGGEDGGGTASGGDGGGASDENCAWYSSCGLGEAWDATTDWVVENKATIAQVVTEVVVGGLCIGAAAGAGLATGGVGFAAAAGCGALAGAAGAAVGNAFNENADHSTAGILNDMAEGAIWGAAGAVLGAGLGKIIAKCHSFLPGTGVLLADGTHKVIEDVEVGDIVVTTDTETGETTQKKVAETITTEYDKDFTEIVISVDGKDSSIVATDTHPFWVPDLKEWVKAGDLRVGQLLRTSAGTHVQITEVSHYTKHQRTHDLTIADIHAYYVLAGDTPVLVHNCGDAELQSELTQLGKARIEEVKASLSEGEILPGAFSVGRDRTTGITYYGESGPATGHHSGVTSRLPRESQLPNGRPPGVCAEARMCTNALNGGASLGNLDIITLNQKGKKFKMCPNCQVWVPDAVRSVLTG
ncbi:polymorphic toxin-type HINT domain-containing protein [Streptomyces sp. FIT100]|uniref:polymorphic toxin-type HINT domain-containing protein n=1 Tax=Streptomyces sp. FIT100 TaxID=2837956 RepID=UPI0021C68910|nr:polymorphic toxin-type HINT domain-containing protein [Streptomyces sp. FIT100]UUN28853.1 RHS repeat-associated core domain-containing protein [Streptomyces sp. FIT100]